VTRFYTYLLLEFDQAFKSGEIEPLAYQVGCHLSAESYRAQNTDDGLVIAYVSALAQIHKTSPSTIRRTLRSLREGRWIDFPEPEERQRRPWLITLTGLAREPQAKSTASPTASEKPPPVTQLSASQLGSAAASMPLPERDRGASRLRPSRARENETKLNEEKTLSEERLDHVVGETSAVGDNGTDRLLGEEEMEDLGTLPLAELHRRYERGEL
jgi:DNA-binding MarR family transcriptional regulator